jgi:hypothetical protein
MSVFSQIRTHSRYASHSILKQIRKHSQLMDMMKIWSLCTVLLISVGAYLIYVNKSSTLWYYLRIASRELQTAEFKHNITILKKLEDNRALRDTLRSQIQGNTPITLTNTIVKIQVEQDIAFLKEEAVAN